RLRKAGFDMGKLEQVIDMLAIGKRPEPKYHDHELQGKLAGIRECHIEPDWLLLYHRDHQQLVLVLIRTGTHSRLFEK
ncbi:type II toxin-antitoxin system YafQ family toxin, partial [Candidatus Peregrinibacteria bacterium]|nr:type II toxin-antitoxin system YafQ family toxin [Candidatus Peregrinibacteria bacterium]